VLLRNRASLGADQVGGILRGSPPTPGTIASTLNLTAAPLGMSPRPMFTTPPMAIDYAFPTVPPVPTAAASIIQGMQPQGAPAYNSGSTSSGDPNMPFPLHGVPPSLAPFPAPAMYPDAIPPPAPTGSGSPYGQMINPDAVSLTGDNLRQLAAPGLVNLLNPFDPQRSVPLIAAVAGGGVIGLVLLLRR
jgi:hypothetical protein